MLACTALVGCTDEGLENGTENQKQPELVRGDAYVNFTINTKTDSSRGITGSESGTTGDIHEDADDSGHHVNGVRNENDINEILVVITKAVDTPLTPDADITGWEKDATTGMVKLYGTTKILSQHDLANGYIGFLKPGTGANNFTATDGKASINEPIRLDYTGSYAIAVVVNPVSGLKTKIESFNGNHKLAYEEILNWDDIAYETLKDASGNVVKNENGTDKLSFQMSNKNEIVVIAKPDNNTPGNPAKYEGGISVERTVSKTTWRWVDKQDLPGTLLDDKYNVYTVPVKTTIKTPVTESFWYQEKMTDNNQKEYTAYTYSKEFHKAKASDEEGTEYWVLFKKKATIEGVETELNSTHYLDNNGKIIVDYVEAIFTTATATEQYTGVIDDSNNNDADDENNKQNTSEKFVEVQDCLLTQDYQKAVEAVDADLVKTLSFVYKDGDGEKTPNYYVHLTHYALTNLTEEVYTVRHIENTQGVMRQFGTLNDNEYLYTPYFTGINGGTFNGFTQDLETVQAAAADFEEGITDGNKGVFRPLPKSGTDGNSNSEHEIKDEEGNVVTSYENVGGFMEYLYENSCKADKATVNNVTGIVFAGDIYDENGAKVPVMYKYGTDYNDMKYYRTLQALVDERGTNGVLTLTTTDENNVTITHKITPNSTNAEAKAAGIDVYENGRCFYYSAQIKHLDNNDPKTIGAMEYAIMRNNIYSLAVTSIKEIGDATLNLTPNTPISDIRSYVTLEVSILPWIVRFNDLEL